MNEMRVEKIITDYFDKANKITILPLTTYNEQESLQSQVFNECAKTFKGTICKSEGDFKRELYDICKKVISKKIGAMTFFSLDVSLQEIIKSFDAHDAINYFYGA